MTQLADQQTAARKIGQWFVGGIIGWLLAGPLVLLLAFMEGNVVWMFGGGLIVLVGWSAMLVAIIGKGVELGVRAANDE